MITKAKFKGQNGSLGFIKGAEYWLKIAIKTKVNITPLGIAVSLAFTIV